GWLLRGREKLLNRVPISACIALLIGVGCLPLLIAWRYDRPFVHTLLTVSWLVIGAGIGEEVFYRGYIQSRINESFGRPFQLGGLQFGAGLLISSLLFG